MEFYQIVRAKVLNTIRKHCMIFPNEEIILGVSGGPDSMALLYLMYDLREELECAFHIAHLNHNLRGEESEADAEYVLEHAHKLDLPVTVETIDVRKMIFSGESLESGARRIRYEFFDRIMTDTHASKVALGHNADDQAETVIMRLLRGSGAQGLGGIPPIRDGKYIRPLIKVSRKEIEIYLKSIGLTPRIDSSNLYADYERNRIRLELIPLLESEYSPNIKQILHQTGDILRAEDEFLAGLACESMEKCVEYRDNRKIIISALDFGKLHIALQRRILRLVIKILAGDLNCFDFNHIKKLLELAIHGSTGNKVILPRGINAARIYDKLVLQSGHETQFIPKSFDYILEVPGETIITDLKLCIETTIKNIKSPQPAFIKKDGSGLKFQETFNYDRIHGELHLRNRYPGDRFQPLGMSGMKKIKDFFIDEKIPQQLRDTIPILTNGNNILWIIGYRIDDRFKVTAETENQLKVNVRYL